MEGKEMIAMILREADIAARDLANSTEGNFDACMKILEAGWQEMVEFIIDGGYLMGYRWQNKREIEIKNLEREDM